jgi:hypothetical protein
MPSFSTKGAKKSRDTITCHYFTCMRNPSKQKSYFKSKIQGFLPSIGSAFQDHYFTDIRWFSLVRMLNRAFDLKTHMELFLEMRGTPFPVLRNHDWMLE